LIQCAGPFFIASERVRHLRQESLREFDHAEEFVSVVRLPLVTMSAMELLVKRVPPEVAQAAFEMLNFFERWNVLSDRC
jgi:hypothetical protein